MLELSAEAVVAADHPCLAGHFPGRPVVPAVLLLELAAAALQEGAGAALQVSGIGSAKFLQPVLPGQVLRFSFDADLERGRAVFRCECGGRLAAQGDLSFVQTQPAA